MNAEPLLVVERGHLLRAAHVSQAGPTIPEPGDPEGHRANVAGDGTRR